MIHVEKLRLTADSTVADLPAHDYSVSDSTPGFAVAEELEQRPGLPGVIIEADREQTYVISRQRFFHQMSRGFSREVYFRRPIGLLARALPHAALRLEETCPIGAAAARALERPPDQVYEPALILGRDGERRLLDAYVLLLAQTRLLELANRTIQQQKEEAEAANRVLRDTQAALVQSEKLASLGQLAAGMSHEINNPISFVSTNVGVLFQEVQHALGLLDRYRAAGARAFDPATVAELACLEGEIDLAFTQANYERQFRASLDGLRRIREIVRNLRDFARLDRADWQETNVNDCLRATLEMVVHELKRKDIRLEADYGPVGPVFVQPGKVNQVFLNVLINALQATSAGGIIRASTCCDAGGGVCVAIQDTGIGILPEHLPRVFEPFFTTKPVGQGMGLGLSISYGIVLEHGGVIEVDSVPGQGSTFRVRLPFQPPVPEKGTGTFIAAMPHARCISRSP
ncbi:MAG: ATP-binding protein [Gemmataceae bacterium]|nr:ATP-binding protein [Gemmataceae bacterium]